MHATRRGHPGIGRPARRLPRIGTRWGATMRISDILRVKGNKVVSVTPGSDVTQLLALLAEHRIGAVIVAAEGARVDGIVSEGDVVRALALRGPAVLTEPVRAIHTVQVRSVSPESA